MKICKFIKYYSFFFFALIFLASANFIKGQIEQPLIFISKQNSSLNLNFQFLNYVNLGHKRFISSLLWVATILESDIDHYKAHDLNSWMFLRFNTISMLEPLFLPTYSFGGPYLSIVKDDLEGASIIYKKGIKLYPNEYHLLKDAAFHFHFELGDYKESYLLYNKIKSLPGFSKALLPTLARMESENGNLQAAFELMNEQYVSYSDKDSFLAKKIGSFLYAIKAEMDLNCLNQKKLNCSTLDYEGHSYFIQNGRFVAIKYWEPFRIKRKKN